MAKSKIKKSKEGYYYVDFEFKKRRKDDPDKYFRKYQRFKIDDGLTQSKMEKQVNFFYNKFLEESEEEYEKENYDINSSMRLSNYLDLYLEHLKNNSSIVYYKHSEIYAKVLKEHLGNYKLDELTPSIIQKFYDKMSKLKIIKEEAYPVENFNELYEKLKYNVVDFKTNINTAHYKWLKLAKEGKKVSSTWAKEFSKYLHLDINILFIYKTFEIDASYNYKKKPIVVLKCALSEAKRKMLIKENYASGDYTKFMKNNKSNKNKTSLTEEEFIKLYEYLLNLSNIEMKTFFIIILNTGARREEVFGLKWKNIDFKKKEICFENTVTAIAGIGKIVNEYQTKNESSNRIVNISNEVLDILIDYKNSKLKIENEQYLFINNKGEVRHPSTANKWLNKILKEINLRHIAVHELRHTYASIMINHLPIAEVSKTLGHSQLSTTLNMYSHKVTNEQGKENILNIINKTDKSMYLEALETLREASFVNIKEYNSILARITNKDRENTQNFNLNYSENRSENYPENQKNS